MPSRRTAFSVGEFYHNFNRGNNKEIIYHDDRDFIRYLFLILFLQSPSVVFKNIGRQVTYFENQGKFNVSQGTIDKIDSTREVAVVTFGLMPNHHHQQTEEITEGGISSYIHRVQTAYSHYYNKKYNDHTGHIFQGTFKSVHQEDNRQLLHTSAYIHRNPSELPEHSMIWKSYPWSSCHDYIKSSRWGKLLKTDVILDQFKSAKEYENFIDTSPAKNKEYLQENFWDFSEIY